MNLQAVFDLIHNHLLKQNEKSYLSKDQVAAFGLEETVCAYRGQNDCKCAIGILIPDEHYNKGMEGCIPSAIKNQLSEDLKDFFSKNANFLLQIQGIHDSVEPKNWSEQLKILAKKYDLKCNQKKS